MIPDNHQPTGVSSHSSLHVKKKTTGVSGGLRDLRHGGWSPPRHEDSPVEKTVPPEEASGSDSAAPGRGQRHKKGPVFMYDDTGRPGYLYQLHKKGSFLEFVDMNGI